MASGDKITLVVWPFIAALWALYAIYDITGPDWIKWVVVVCGISLGVISLARVLFGDLNENR